MLRPLIALTLGISAAAVISPQVGSAQACGYLKGLSQGVNSTSFGEGGKLPLALGLGAGATALTAVGVTLWQRRRQTAKARPAAVLELDVVLPESDTAMSSDAEDATPIA